MPDNVVFQSSTLATPAASTTVASDDVGGVQYQRVKLDIGGDGLASPVTTANPLPIGTLPGGTVQTFGTTQVLGSVQPVGTVQALGSIQLVGTNQALGTLSVQGLTPYLSGGGSANPIIGGGVALAARPGTSTVGSVVRDWYDQHGRQVVQVGNGTTAVLGTFYTANGNGTLLPAIGAGSFVRIYDILVSGSAAGTVRILNDTTPVWGPLFLAANGGWNANSAVGFKFGANTSFTVVNGMGSLSVTINYGVEGA